MAENKTALTNIINECVKALGYETVLEIVNSTKPTKEEKPKIEEKPKDEKKKSRITRMTAAILTELRTELGKVGLQYKDDDKKGLDKIKKDFTGYVDDLTDKDFTEKSLTQHMLDFANTKKPAPVVETKQEEKVVKVEEKPKKEKKTAKKKEEAVVNKEMPKEVSNAAEEPPKDKTLEELKAIEMIATPGGEFEGVYWDADDGNWVRGPPAVEDEDLVEIGFGKKTFMVGEQSHRIYVEAENGGLDVFVGYVGVGHFKDMKMP